MVLDNHSNISTTTLSNNSAASQALKYIIIIIKIKFIYTKLPTF